MVGEAMSATTINGRMPVRVGKRLEKNHQLAAKVRDLNEILRKILGVEIPAEWDLHAREPENVVSIHIGEPGRGECTRWIMESLLEKTPWLEGVFVDMKESLDIVRIFLAEVDKLFWDIRRWITQYAPSLKVGE